jgi:hypothetical protein
VTVTTSMASAIAVCVGGLKAAGGQTVGRTARHAVLRSLPGPTLATIRPLSLTVFLRAYVATLGQPCVTPVWREVGSAL